MTPAARVQTAIELLEPILEGAPAERILTQWARKSRFAGSKDRAAIRDHVFDVLRRKNSAANSGGGETPRALMIGLLRLQGVSLNDIFIGGNYGPEPMSDAESSSEDVGEVLDLPEWITPDLNQALGDDFSAIEAHLKERAPVILRVNLLKSTRAAAKTALENESVVTVEHNACETALEVTEGARKLRNSPAYKNGEIELQDAASQAAIAMLPEGDLGRVLDYCAGGGGKLLAMAGRNPGSYFAHDAIPARLRDLPERAKRAGVQVKTLATEELKEQAAFDLVFCDVPCSGSGTWRRDPDTKWKLDRDTLNKTLKLQGEILDASAELVAEGKFLAYATCSLLPSENEEQIQSFLDRHSGWNMVYQKRWTPLDGCDGFFTTLLKKTVS